MDIISIENITLSRTASWCCAPITKFYVTCGHTTFMTWRYPLNNSDIIWPGHAKTCHMSYANNKGADQSAHPRSLISAFVVRSLDSIIFLVSRFKAGLNLNWSQTLEDKIFAWRGSYDTYRLYNRLKPLLKCIWVPSSEFVSSSIPSWQTLTARMRRLAWTSPEPRIHSTRSFWCTDFFYIFKPCSR